jgi:hypothetical protein
VCDPSTRMRKKITIATKIQSSTTRGQRSPAILAGFSPPSPFFTVIPSEDMRIGAVFLQSEDTWFKDLKQEPFARHEFGFPI